MSEYSKLNRGERTITINIDNSKKNINLIYCKCSNIRFNPFRYKVYPIQKGSLFNNLYILEFIFPFILFFLEGIKDDY